MRWYSQPPTAGVAFRVEGSEIFILFQKSDYFSLKKQNDLIFLLHKLNCIVMSEIGNHGYMQSNVNCFSRYLEDENYQFIHYYNKLFLFQVLLQMQIIQSQPLNGGI